MFPVPIELGYIPVIIALLAGAHTGYGEFMSSYTSPFSSKRLMLGKLTDLFS
tara:strand:+ start:3700 stop:3855 length:156 start_codon:yes stop_codon:yes gene_type:complete